MAAWIEQIAHALPSAHAPTPRNTGIQAQTRRAVRRMRSAPIEIHPRGRQVSADNQRWVTSVGLAPTGSKLAQIAAIRCGSFAAHTYNRAPTPVVQLGADLIAWLYLWDDRVGESQDLDSSTALSQRFGSYEHVIRWRALPADANELHRSLLGLISRAVDLGASSQWVERFGDSMAAYFDGCALEFPYRRSRRPPTVLDYTYLRSLSVGAYPVFDLIELGSGVPLSESEFARLRSLRYLASLLCAWVNDVYSFPKELADKEPLNIVAALACERELGPADALEAAADLFNADYARFDRLVAIALSDSPSVGVARYVDGLCDWVMGNRAWTKLCGRYS